MIAMYLAKELTQNLLWISAVPSEAEITLRY